MVVNHADGLEDALFDFLVLDSKLEQILQEELKTVLRGDISKLHRGDFSLLLRRFFSDFPLVERLFADTDVTDALWIAFCGEKILKELHDRVGVQMKTFISMLGDLLQRVQ